MRGGNAEAAELEVLQDVRRVAVGVVLSGQSNVLHRHSLIIIRDPPRPSIPPLQCVEGVQNLLDPPTEVSDLFTTNTLEADHQPPALG